MCPARNPQVSGLGELLVFSLWFPLDLFCGICGLNGRESVFPLYLYDGRENQTFFFYVGDLCLRKGNDVCYVSDQTENSRISFF